MVNSCFATGREDCQEFTDVTSALDYEAVIIMMKAGNLNRTDTKYYN